MQPLRSKPALATSHPNSKRRNCALNPSEAEVGSALTLANAIPHNVTVVPKPWIGGIAQAIITVYNSGIPNEERDNQVAALATSVLETTKSCFTV
jgi:hypothetical protein